MFITSKKEAIKKYLISVGAQKIPHIKNGSLFDHLCRVGDILEYWGLSEEVIYAGMCHSLYSTEVFKTAVLTVDKRNELISIIGSSSEGLVYTFCTIKRSSFSVSEDVYSYEHLFSKERISLSKEVFISIQHILLANDIDHLNSFNIPSRSSSFGKYVRWMPLLCQKAKEYLSSFAVDRSTENEEGSDVVRFIAHAGVHIKTPNVSVAIDPWLYSSSRQQPRLQGFDPTSFTIDYLIPEPKNTIADIKSDIILLSHFHTHHAPLQEIKELASLCPVDIVCPFLSEEKLLQLRATVGDAIFNSITFHFISKDTDLTIKGVTISCFTHSHPEHFAFLVKTKRTSVLQMADISINATRDSLDFAPFWEKFYGLSPEFLFITSAGHNTRQINKYGERSIVENITLTPTQAAKATCKIKPKHVGIVGVYNFSVWDNRIEYARTYEAAESEFYWAMSFLAPAIQVHQLRPGDFFLSGK
jgi:hypothetical protein